MITVRLFARLREQAGVGSEQLDLPGGTVAEVYEALVRRHPGLEPDRARVRPARNEEFARWEDPVVEGDEVAFIPPVSGGAGPELIELTTAALDVRATEAAVAHPGAGAICSFTGIVRDNNRGEAVTHLEYEAYGGMAERQMRRIAENTAGNVGVSRRSHKITAASRRRSFCSSSAVSSAVASVRRSTPPPPVPTRARLSDACASLRTCSSMTTPASEHSRMSSSQLSASSVADRSFGLSRAATSVKRLI